MIRRKQNEPRYRRTPQALADRAVAYRTAGLLGRRRRADGSVQRRLSELARLSELSPLIWFKRLVGYRRLI
jgi:hypothetical protein